MTRKFNRGPAKDLVDRHRALRDPYECVFGGANLLVPRGVFVPSLSNASLVLLESVQFEGRSRCLDMFCGSGAFGIIAALRGAQSVLVDKSHLAADCARSNAERNGLSDRVQVVVGDVLTASSSLGRFDLVIANPPLLPQAPHSEYSEALASPDFSAIRSFISGLSSWLQDSSSVAYLVTSSIMDDFGMPVESLLDGAMLEWALVNERSTPYEHYRVHQISTIEGRGGCHRGS